MQVSNEIRKTALEEIRQNAPPTPAAPAADPMTAALGIAKELLTIRADNPMLTIMSEQLTALRSELSAQRERSDRLMEKLAEKNNAPAPPPTDPLATVKSIFDTFKSVREQAAEVLPTSEGRGHRMSFLEWAQPIGLKLADAFGPIAEAIAHNAMSPAPANGAAPQIQQRPAAQQQDFSAFLDMLTPRILHFFHDYTPEAGPAEFASWFYDGWGDQAKRAVDKIETSGGVPALMNWYRSSRHWAAIAEIEPEFTKFLTAALAWKPEGEQPQAPEDATEHEVIDLEAQEEAANAAN